MWAQVDEVRGKYKAVPRPPNSYTVEEYAQRYGIARPTASAQLNALCRKGKLKSHSILELDTNGVQHRRYCYTVLSK